MNCMRRSCAALLLACAAAAWAQQTRPATAVPDLIARLIEQLGDPHWPVREAAQQKLRETEDPALLPALRRAMDSEDPEVANRAALLLDDLRDFTHVVVDAMGQPIAAATITVIFADANREPTVLRTNAFGGLSIPSEEGVQSARLRFEHPQFGTAEGRAPVRLPATRGEPAAATEFRVPFVREGTEARGRALAGVVLDPEGGPVPGARIVCQCVRTPGEGLIQYHHRLPEVLTDAAGRFTLYLPDSEPGSDRGRLIPPASRFYLGVAARSAGLFPYVGQHYNTRTATIRLRRPGRFHRFEFEAPGGGRLSGSQLEHVSVVYVGDRDGHGGIGLDSEYVRAGGRLLPGRYAASQTMSNTTYVPLEVADDSPETLLFRLPPPLTFRGRIVDGVTGKPMAGAFVFSCTSIGRNNLAMLTDQQWRQLEGLPANPSPKDPALRCLVAHFHFQAIARTDDQGRYELLQPAGDRFEILGAFARDRLPYRYSTGKLAPDGDRVVAVPDMPLFPAASVVVKPVASGVFGVLPRWRFAAGGQPEWLERLSNPPQEEGRVDQDRWLRLNEVQPCPVPAGVELTLELLTPYDEQLCDATYEKPIRLAAGGSLDIGEVVFARALRVTVRAVDEAGKGVEGVPVRWMYEGTNTWSLAHNTDADGLARFFAVPNSRGKFGVPDFPRRGTEQIIDEPQVAFEVGDKAPAEPWVITLTPAHIQKLFGR
jgi:hypothetical protein